MFSVETIKKLGEVLHISDFEAKLKSEKEEVLEVPVLITDDDKNKFGENRFNEGKKAATEILVKDLKVKHGLEFEGKSIDTLLSTFAEKAVADAKIAPDEKVKKLDTENKELKSKLQAATDKETTLTKEFETKLFNMGTQSQILSFIPEKTIIPREDLAVLFMNSHRVAKEDDRIIVYKGAEALKDTVLNPVPLKDVVSQFAEKYIDKGGMGGGDNGGGASGKFKTMSAFMAHCEKNHIEPMGAAGQKLLSENKDAAFDYNS
jgi:hypothetical protein